MKFAAAIFSPLVIALLLLASGAALAIAAVCMLAGPAWATLAAATALLLAGGVLARGALA